MRVYERLRVFCERPRALTGLGVLCRQMSRFVCKCRAKSTYVAPFWRFFAVVVGDFVGAWRLVCVHSLGCGLSDWVEYVLLVLRLAEVGRVFEGVIIARIGADFGRIWGSFCGRLIAVVQGDYVGGHCVDFVGGG